MDTVVHRKSKKWFRIIGHEDVYYELRPLGQNKHAKDTNDIEVHINDLKKNYYKKDYPEVTCYNLADQEETEREDTGDMNNYQSTGLPTSVNLGMPAPACNIGTTAPLEPAENVRASDKSMEDLFKPGEPESLAIAADKNADELFTVSRKFLQRIDRILDAVEPAGATADELESTKELIAHIIIRGIQEEIDA